MPAIQVARTDTFEIQRQKINQIGSQIFSVTSGGSDLAAGNLKLGDGTRTAPSLAFENETGLGIYRPETGLIGFTSTGKKIADFSSVEILSYKDFIIRQKVLTNSGVAINNYGTLYDPGTYSNVPVVGGTGDSGLFDITVTEYTGSVSNAGKNYVPGSYTNVGLSGGTGSGAIVAFVVDAIDGSITNAGSGYVPGLYLGVSLTGGSGSSAIADITIDGATVLSGSISPGGSGYTNGNYTDVAVSNIPTTTYTVTVVSNPGSPPPDNVYQINGNTQQSLTISPGNTYRFDVSDASVSGHPLVFQNTDGSTIDQTQYVVANFGAEGVAGSYVELIVKPTATVGTIKYNCSLHDGMGANITVQAGATGNYGSFGRASVTVSGGAVTDFSFSTAGQDYKLSDNVTVSSLDVGGTGTGFVFVLAAPTYTGEVTTVNITSSGQDYETNDVLSVNDADVGGGGGSSFAYTVSSNPTSINPTSLQFTAKGSGYIIGDQLTLPQAISISSVTLNGIKTGVVTTLSTSSPQITVADTSGIAPGQAVTNFPESDVGVLAANTTVLSVDSATTLTLSATPTGAGAVELTFTSPNPGNEIVLPDVTGIVSGDLVSISSGTGSLDSTTVVAGVDVNTNTVVINPAAVEAGVATVAFTKAFGNGDGNFAFDITNLGEVETISISDGGNGYSLGDQLTVNPFDLTQPLVKTVTNKTIQNIDFVSTLPSGTFSVGDSIKRVDGQVINVTIDNVPTLIDPDGSYTGVAATGGTGGGATFDVLRDFSGLVNTVTINDGGKFYTAGDVITIPGNLVGGASPADDIQLSVDGVNENDSAEIYDIKLSGGNITSIVIDNISAATGDFIVDASATLGATEYEVNSSLSSTFRWFIDDVYSPDLTLYVGSTYQFNTSDASNSGHLFAFSTFPGGIWNPSYIENLTTILDVNSDQITVTSTTGIVAGMQVILESGAGSLPSGTTVASVIDATTLQLSANPINPGESILSFRGFEFTEGVSRTTSALTLKVTESTPTTLYYYCATESDLHQEEGGYVGEEAVVTIDPNNPKTFGSGLLLTVAALDTSDVITMDIGTGAFTALSVTSNESTFVSSTVSGQLTAPTIASSDVTLTNINAESASVNIASSTLSVSGTTTIGSFITLTSTSGNISTSGVIKTTNEFNSNDQLKINNNNILTLDGIDLLLSPPANRVAKVDSSTALIIPSGTTSDRPLAGVVEDGAIRFNTETSQYEGYSSTTSSWSSLGGVRDLDGNTYITAELSVGANDNTLRFYNDGNNTIRITPEWLYFSTVKKITSENVTAPSYVLWFANSPYTVGQYVKYRNNIYEVTASTGSGLSASSGNEPTHTTGAQNNGDLELTWYASAVAPLTFDEIEELQVGPFGNLPLVVNAELRFADNVISTDISDLLIRPNAGKKVTIDAATTLTLPVGSDADRGVPLQGGIRFNTTSTQFEGYDGTNWGSLGGVKDVDQNTYIIPETAPGANENILYFFNDNNNTLRLSTTSLDFDTIDTIRSVTSNEFEITASLLTIDSAATTIDNTAVNTTFIHTSKQYLDLGLSAGITVDPVLRFENNGDVYFNTTFGTGSFTGIKVFDSELKEFELDGVKILTEKITLVKGTSENGASIVYSLATEAGAKTTLIAVNTNTGEKEFIEFGIVDDGTDIYHTEYGNIRTGSKLIVPTFEVTPNSEARINVSLSSDVANTQTVNITFHSNITKK